MKTTSLLAIIATIYIALVDLTPAFAQAPTVFTTGLQGPTKIIIAGQLHLLVTETGTPSPNSGQS